MSCSMCDAGELRVRTVKQNHFGESPKSGPHGSYPPNPPLQSGGSFRTRSCLPHSQQLSLESRQPVITSSQRARGAEARNVLPLPPKGPGEGEAPAFLSIWFLQEKGKNKWK